MGARAQIEAELTGGGKVQSEAKKISKALEDAKKNASAGIQGAIDSSTGKAQLLGSKIDTLKSAISPTAILGGFLGGAVLSGIAAIGSYLAEAKDKAKAFGETSNQTARQTGAGLAGLRSSYQQNLKDTGVAIAEQDDFVRSIQKTSYAGKAAADGLDVLTRVAQGQGKSLMDYAGAFTSFTRGMGMSGHDAANQIATLTAQAERLKTVGGPQALIDTIAALGPALDQVSGKVPGATAKIEAFVAILSKKMKPEQARAVASQAIGAIQGNSYMLEKVLGHKVLDENGNVTDPVRDLAQLKKYVGHGESGRNALISHFGPQLGSAIFNTDFGDVDKEVKEHKADEPELKGFNDFMASPEGQRIVREGKQEVRKLNVGVKVQGAADNVDQATEDLISGKSGPVSHDVVGYKYASSADVAKGAEGAGTNAVKGIHDAAHGAEGLWSNIVKGFSEALHGASKDIGRETANALKGTRLQVSPPPGPWADNPQGQNG